MAGQTCGKAATDVVNDASPVRRGHPCGKMKAAFIGKSVIQLAGEFP